MSKAENTRPFFLSIESTKLEVKDDELRLHQGGGVFVFTTPQDFMEFVSRLGILAVRLDQEMINLAARAQTSRDDEGTPV